MLILILSLKNILSIVNIVSPVRATAPLTTLVSYLTPIITIIISIAVKIVKSITPPIYFYPSPSLTLITLFIINFLNYPNLSSNLLLITKTTLRLKRIILVFSTHSSTILII